MTLRALSTIVLLVLAGCAKEEPSPGPIGDRSSPSAWVFFDFDSAEIRPQSWNALGSFASDVKYAKEDYAKHGHPNAGGRIFVCAYADNVGSRSANLAISQRRAEAIRDALVELGISADEIVPFGVGDQYPLVLTANGVREPQNRRAKIGLEYPLYDLPVGAGCDRMIRQRERR